MPRSISLLLLEELYAPRTGEIPLLFLELDHPELIDPIRVVNDIIDYVYLTNTYVGCPFAFNLISDSENRPPRAQISIQNVDRNIGNTLINISDTIDIKLTIVASNQFNLTVDPRVEISSPSVIEYEADFLTLKNVSVNVGTIKGTIESFDFTREPWPFVRATKERLPGLFR